MATITQITAREILDSRGNPTIETTTVLNDGTSVSAAVPSGASVGGYEAVELRDKDPKHYLGMGVLSAINNVNSIIAPQLINNDPAAQQALDRKMLDLDGTDNKQKLGANAILSVSMSIAKATAASYKLPLYRYIKEYILHETTPYKVPTPVFNIINGGKHAGQNVDIQEFIIVPGSFKKFHEALELGVVTTRKLKDILKLNSLSTMVGDEGGFAPELASNEDPLSLMTKAVENAGFRMGYDVFLGIDAAANSFFVDGKYKLKGHSTSLSAGEVINFYEDLISKYPILYIEDPLAEDDWEGWQKMYTQTGKQTLLVGDDLVCTNPLRLQTALEKKTIGGVIIKPNQIGTVSESVAVVAMSKAANLKVIVSHRSGETNDDFIADFAVGVNAEYAKFGAPVRGERLAKYNRLLAIESEIAANTQQK